MKHDRTVLAAFVLVLVGLAFVRAGLGSSTGIVNVGDAADYEAIAAGLSLEGRAPFVYRPLVPLAVGLLFSGRLMLGFGIVCFAAMYAALFTIGALPRDSMTGYLLAAILFLNYQVLFAAAYPARLDIVVLAVPLAFVWLALKERRELFVALLPLCALLKESMLLGLVALAVLAFPRGRDFWARLAASATAFVALHALIRWLAQPTAYMPPYDGGSASAGAMLELAATNLSASTPLAFLVAWGGLCFVALYAAFGGGAGKPDPLPAGIVVFLLAFPIPLVTDVHRAWFELLAPAVLFVILRRARRDDGAAIRPALILALGASVVPYATRAVAVEHLYLLVLDERLSAAATGALIVTLAFAGAALVMWIRGRMAPA